MRAVDLTRYTVPVDGPLAFVREQCILADGRRVGDALGDDEWIERNLLRPVFERDDRDLPLHRLCYLELPRGHWKSGGAAAIAAAEAVLEADTDVVIAAADRDQAAIIGENLDGFLARNPALRASFVQRGDEYEVPARRSRIRVISSDVASSWGLGGTHRRFRVIADELTVWAGERGEQLWTSLASATGKTPDVQTLVLSNAGFEPGRCWQWRVRETAERQPWGYLYSTDGIVASWVTDEWVEQMRELLPGAAFERVILNRWSGRAGDFVTEEQWHRIVDERLSPQARGEGRFFAGLDLGLRKDRTALAVVAVDGDGIRLADLQVWQGTRAEPVSIAAIERAVADAAERYPRLRVSADPWQLEGSMERLRAAGVRVEPFNFTASSVQHLSTALHSAITSARMRVYPDRELEREILGLQVVQTPTGWKFDHRAGGFSDRAVALGMAVAAAVEQAGKRVGGGAAAVSLSSTPEERRGRRRSVEEPDARRERRARETERAREAARRRPTRDFDPRYA